MLLLNVVKFYFSPHVFIQEITASKHEDRKQEEIWIHFQQYLAPELLTESEIFNSEGYS